LLIPRPCTESQLKAHVAEWVKVFNNDKVRMAYRISLNNFMKSEVIKRDVLEGAPLWEKLTAGASNIVYRKIPNLAQVLCDDTIEEIIQKVYGYGGGVSPSMWDSRDYKLGFGDTKDHHN
jgi:hypothetical protein